MAPNPSEFELEGNPLWEKAFILFCAVFVIVVVVYGATHPMPKQPGYVLEVLSGGVVADRYYLSQYPAVSAGGVYSFYSDREGGWVSVSGTVVIRPRDIR